MGLNKVTIKNFRLLLLLIIIIIIDLIYNALHINKNPNGLYTLKETKKKKKKL